METARRAAMRGELRERLYAAMDTLPPRDAALVRLHYTEGFSINEAAGIVGVREGTAKVALHRARRRLRERLIEEREDVL